MELICHRCSATLEPEAHYCQECGAPQLSFVPQQDDRSSSLSNVEGTLRKTGHTSPDAIHWKHAIRIAVLVSVVVGLLSTVLAAGSVLWVAVGAVLVIGFYRRQLPDALLLPRLGARIGLLVGLLASFVSVAGNAVSLLIQRYGLHQGYEIDSQLTSIVKQAAEHAASVDSQAAMTTFTNFWLSGEGRIGLVLLTMAFLSVLIVVFAIAGGVLGAQIYRTPRTRNVAP